MMVISHDIELMARYCDRLTLLYESKVLISGTASEVIQPHFIKQAYDCDVELKELNNIPQIIPRNLFPHFVTEELDLLLTMKYFR